MIGCPGSPNGYRYMSMAGALGDRWAIRTQASGEAPGAVVAADAAGDVAATTAAVPPSSIVIAASRANLLSSLMVTYLSSIPCPRPSSAATKVMHAAPLWQVSYVVGQTKAPPSAAPVGSAPRTRCSARPDRWLTWRWRREQAGTERPARAQWPGPSRGWPVRSRHRW